MMRSGAPVRIGILGAARVAPMALLDPARNHDDIEVVAIGARDVVRARAFAEEHRIPRVHTSYDDVLTDPELNAVYIPLPATHNGRWTLAALEAGKHVLVEKPMAANAAEADVVAEAAAASGLTVLQGYHYRYHPYFERIRALLDHGAVGEPELVQAWFMVRRPADWNIRWRYELGGGTLMDHGSYPVHLARSLLRREPAVVSAQAVRQADARNDGTMDAVLDFGGVTARVHSSMLGEEFSVGARVRGTDGTLEIDNYIHPTMGSRLTLSRTDGDGLDEHFPADRPTFAYQLDAFIAAVTTGASYPTDSRDGAANLRVIDAAYDQAGLPLRMSQQPPSR
jgi:predicted dehydrogenase